MAFCWLSNVFILPGSRVPRLQPSDKRDLTVIPRSVPCSLAVRLGTEGPGRSSLAANGRANVTRPLRLSPRSPGLTGPERGRMALPSAMARFRVSVGSNDGGSVGDTGTAAVAGLLLSSDVHTGLPPMRTIGVTRRTKVHAAWEIPSDV